MTTPLLGLLHKGTYLGILFQLFREETDDDRYELVLDVQSADGEKHYTRRITSMEQLSFLDNEFIPVAVGRLKTLVQTKLAEHPVESEDLLQ